jgi:hypothetical protein
LIDVGSKNGTFDVDNKKKLEKNTEYKINDNQKFSFGEIYCYVERIK